MLRTSRIQIGRDCLRTVAIILIRRTVVTAAVIALYGQTVLSLWQRLDSLMHIEGTVPEFHRLTAYRIATAVRLEGPSSIAVAAEVSVGYILAGHIYP